MGYLGSTRVEKVGLRQFINQLKIIVSQFDISLNQFKSIVNQIEYYFEFQFSYCFVKCYVKQSEDRLHVCD